MTAAPGHVLRALSDVQQIVSDRALTPEARNQRVADRKAVALSDHMKALLSVARDVTVDGWTIHVEDAFLSPETGAVELHGVTAVDPNGLRVSGLDPHRLFVNPPLLFPDPAGNVDLGERGTFRVDPAACILDVIFQAAVQEQKKLLP